MSLYLYKQRSCSLVPEMNLVPLSIQMKYAKTGIDLIPEQKEAGLTLKGSNCAPLHWLSAQKMEE